MHKFLGTVMAPLLTLMSSAPALADPIKVDGGLIAGKMLSFGVKGWFGVPFAALPLRDLRWKAPKVMMMRYVMMAGAALALTACAVAQDGKAQVKVEAQAPMVSGFVGGAGQAETVAACAACHPSTMVTTKHFTEDKWAEVVDQMIAKGAKVNDSNYEVIVTYLARNYGVGKAG